MITSSAISAHELGDNPRPLRWPAGWGPVLLFAGAMLALRLVFLAGFDPFTLIEDEAHYWEWSRRLGLSYYSKGPGVAWAIAAATALFGDTEWAVRLPAMLACSLGSLAAAGLARDVFNDRRLMLLSAVAYQAMPGIFATGLLMTIDGPYVACWTFAAWGAWRALAMGKGPAWVWTGLALSLGFLFKYTILLLPLGIVLFAILRRGHLRIASERGRTTSAGWVLAGVICSLLGLLPILIWNAGHDWATVRHLLGHLGVEGGDMPAKQGAGQGWSYSPLWTLEFLGLQFAVAGAIFPLVALGAVNMVRARRAGRAEWIEAGPAFLLCCALPLLVFYMLVTLFTRVEANWTMAAYATLAPVAAWAAADGIRRHDRPIRFTWHFAVIVFALMILTPPVLAWYVRTPDAPVSVVGRISPFEPYMAEIDKLADRVREETGEEPVYIAVHYGRASQLAFYLEGRPTTYAASSHFGDGRRTQYDVWPSTDLANPETADRLRGRNAILSNGSVADWLRIFERVEDAGILPHEPKAGRHTLIGYGFTGVPDERPREGETGADTR